MNEAKRNERRVDRLVGQRTCQWCDVEGRCVGGKTYAWNSHGEVVGDCHCSCHMRTDGPEIERIGKIRIIIQSVRQLVPPNG